MKLRIHNTLSGKIEDFIPIDKNNVRMYVCGPTVYDRAHLGNARPAVVFDILYRILQTLYKKVTYVRNITDIDDKIYKASIEKNIAISDLTKKTTVMYHDDMAELNVLPVTIEPKATEHISDMIEFIKNLIINGNASHIPVRRHTGAAERRDADQRSAGCAVCENIRKGATQWQPSDSM